MDAPKAGYLQGSLTVYRCATSPYICTAQARAHERMTVTTHHIIIACHFYPRRHIDWKLLLGHQRFIPQFYLYSMYIEGRKDARKKIPKPQNYLRLRTPIQITQRLLSPRTRKKLEQACRLHQSKISKLENFVAM